MDIQQFEDYLSANKKNLGDKFIKESRGFFNRLQTANRLYKAAFSESAAADPRNPGEMQGTLLLAKMQQEVMFRQKTIDNNGSLKEEEVAEELKTKEDQDA